MTVPLRLFGPPSERRAWRSLHEALTPDDRPGLEVSGLTDTGCVRADNQDQFLIAELERGLLVRSSSMAPNDGTTVTDSAQGWLLAVADGVGGNAHGDVASAIAVDTVAHYALTLMPWVVLLKEGELEMVEHGLRTALHSAQARMIRLAERKGIPPVMATTFTMAYITWPELFVAHVGDSRCYLERDGELRRLTRDHTMAEELISSGVDPNQLRSSQLRNVLVNVVGGRDQQLSIDLHHTTLQRDDHLLLCTDGLTHHLSDEELTTRLTERRPVDVTVQEMIDQAKKDGGIDNVTAVVARF